MPARAGKEKEKAKEGSELDLYPFARTERSDLMFSFIRRLFGDPFAPYRDVATPLVQSLGCQPQWEGAEDPLMCSFQVQSGNRMYSCWLSIAGLNNFMLFVDSQTEAANFPVNIHAELCQRNRQLRLGQWCFSDGYLRLSGEVKVDGQIGQAFRKLLYELLGEVVEFDDAYSQPIAPKVQVIFQPTGDARVRNNPRSLS
jgi:hypothetical protein